MAVSLILSILVGIALGITGAGGGIIAIPVLMFGMQWDLLTAGPVALIAISAGAWVGAFYAYRTGLLNIKAGLLMAVAGMPMTPIGQSIAKQISGDLLISLFIIVLLIVAIRMWKSAKHTLPVFNETKNEAKQHNNTSISVFALIGIIAGFMTGLLSVGGGFIIVPLLKQFSHLSMKQASATSLLVIAIVSSTGVVSAVNTGVNYPFPFTLWFTLTVIGGLIVGRILSQYLPDDWVQRIFSLFLIFIGVLMLIQNFF